MFATAGFAQGGFGTWSLSALAALLPGEPSPGGVGPQPAPVRIGADDYTQLLMQLLPSGPAWPRDADSFGDRLFSAAGQELAAIHLRIEQLIEEADPRTTSELLPDWERAVGLPDPCFDAPTSIVERRRRVVQRITSEGGQSAAFFIGVLEALGFPGATVTEFRPMRCNSKCNAAINQGGWRFGWRVSLPVATVMNVMNCTSPCVSPLASWGDPGLQCLLATHKPAHTRLLVAYST